MDLLSILTSVRSFLEYTLKGVCLARCYRLGKCFSECRFRSRAGPADTVTGRKRFHSRLQVRCCSSQDGWSFPSSNSHAGLHGAFICYQKTYRPLFTLPPGILPHPYHQRINLKKVLEGWGGADARGTLPTAWHAPFGTSACERLRACSVRVHMRSEVGAPSVGEDGSCLRDNLSLSILVCKIA